MITQSKQPSARKVPSASEPVDVGKMLRVPLAPSLLGRAVEFEEEVGIRPLPAAVELRPDWACLEVWSQWWLLSWPGACSCSVKAIACKELLQSAMTGKAKQKGQALCMRACLCSDRLHHSDGRVHRPVSIACLACQDHVGRQQALKTAGCRVFSSLLLTGSANAERAGPLSSAAGSRVALNAQPDADTLPLHPQHTASSGTLKSA